MEREPDEVEDICFLALTRPAMFLGVPMEAFALNGVATTVIFLVAGSIKYALLGFVMHFVARALVWHDHNRFNLIAAWIETRGIQRNTAYWGGSSVSPARLKHTYTLADATHV